MKMGTSEVDWWVNWLFRAAIVVAVAVGFLALCLYRNVDVWSDPPEVRKAMLQIKANFATALDTFAIAVRRYPSTEEGLRVLTTTSWTDPHGRRQVILKTVPRDPWGNEYQYVYPGTHNRDSYDLWSSGPDGKPGGGDDIANWEEDGQGS
jgi:general secretion pathway protein G